MNTNKWLICLSTLLMACIAKAGIISATYTEQTGTVLVDFDTLKIEGHGVSDWMIFDDSSADNIHDRKLEGQHIVNPLLSPKTPYTSYTFSWSDGAIGSGTNETGLGYNIFGVANFQVQAPAESDGTYRMYVEAGASDQTFWIASLSQGITIPSGTHGYIDAKYDNTSASADVLTLFSTYITNDTSIYAIAVSQVPEPAVMSLVLLFGTGILFIKRRFSV